MYIYVYMYIYIYNYIYIWTGTTLYQGSPGTINFSAENPLGTQNVVHLRCCWAPCDLTFKQ